MHLTLEGHDRPVPVEPQDSILDALLRAGLPFPYSCDAGNCGTCRCELIGGEVLELARSEHALTDAERARGIILACRTRAMHSVSIRRMRDRPPAERS